MMDEVNRRNCARCGRRLSDPLSVRRGMGPVCWAASKGDVFESNLEATDEEWARREALLRCGGEIDFGSNWQFDQSTQSEPDLIPCRVRVTLRCVGGEFEVYGYLARSAYVDGTEVVFGRSADIRMAYAIAVAAGPQCEAKVYRMQKRGARRARRAYKAA